VATAANRWIVPPTVAISPVPTLFIGERQFNGSLSRADNSFAHVGGVPVLVRPEVRGNRMPRDSVSLASLIPSERRSSRR
jgi:hypothetical protein